MIRFFYCLCALFMAVFMLGDASAYGAEGSEAFQRKVVVEEGTGTWCQWCPRGIVGFRMMKEKYPDQFIGIAVHANDELATASYQDLVKIYFANFPSCIVNRNDSLLMDPSFANLEYAFKTQVEKPATADIRLSAHYTDASRNIVAVTTSTRFASDEEKAAYRIAFVVLENGVTGCLQYNAFASGKFGEMGGFESLPVAVSINMDHVARDIYKSYTGIMKSVPTTLSKDSVYQYSYDLTLPLTIQNKDSIEIVAMLINSRSREIVNADLLSTISDFDTAIRSISASAPCKAWVDGGVLQVAGAYDSYKVYSEEGMPCRADNLTSGIYIIQFRLKDKMWIQKVVSL